jgi:Tol biopolymer transport system component
VLDVESGRSTLLVDDDASGRPVYSGDGCYVFYNHSTTSENDDLYRVDVQTGRIERVTTRDSSEYGADWTP